ncbi:MAG: phosphatidylglycerophosphatase A [Phycisphaerales bacterium]
MTDAPGFSHKNKHRAPVKPLNAPTLALSTFGLGFLRRRRGRGDRCRRALVFVMLLAGAGAASVNGAVVGVLLLSSIACVVFGRYAEKRFGLKDAPEVVADETAGVCLALLFWPSLPSGFVEIAVYCAAAFVLFRISDIIKPWPAGRLEKLPQGWGVLMDDLMAGVYAMLAMQIGLRVLLPALAHENARERCPGASR